MKCQKITQKGKGGKQTSVDFRSKSGKSGNQYGKATADRSAENAMMNLMRKK